MSTHWQSVESFEDYFTKALKRKEELEQKIENAVDLQKQLAELKSSADFLAQDNFDKLREETAAKEKRFSR